jgi:hypothetical protein
LSLALREKHRLRVFENRVLRKLFGQKRDEVTRDWRKLHNEELHNLYSSPNVTRIIRSRSMRWAGHVARMKAKNNAYRLQVRRPERKRPLGRSRRKLVDNIKMDVRGIGWSGVDWIDLAQDTDCCWDLVNTLNEPSIKCWEVLENCTTDGFSRRAELHGVIIIPFYYYYYYY